MCRLPVLFSDPLSDVFWTVAVDSILASVFKLASADNDVDDVSAVDLSPSDLKSFAIYKKEFV
jgi:hypothetical protein